MKLHIFNRITWLSTFLVVGALAPSLAHAGWGSIQGNNRSAASSRSSAAARPTSAESRTKSVGSRQETAPVMRDQSHAVDRVQPGRVPVDNARAVQADHQRMDFAAERNQSFFWSDFHAGTRIDRLPDGYRNIGVRGHRYFYFEGIFYDNGPSGYVMVAPPLDAEITDLPPGVETVVLGDTTYYYAGGAYYVQQADGSYIVVAPPIGVIVSTFPPDAASVVIGGTTCYQANGAYYQPVMQNGLTAYLTINL